MRYSITEFETIYLRCFPNALKLAALMLHDADEARDVVQEAFIKLWEADSVIENEQGYIIRAVRNLCLNRIACFDARERIKRKLPLKEIDEGDDEPPVTGERIRDAVTSLLSPRERDVVEKIYEENLSYKDTAKRLEVSVSMVNKSIVGALKKLRNHFKSER